MERKRCPRGDWDGDGRLPDGERGVPIPLDLGVLGAGAHEIVVKKREAQASPRQPRLDVLCLRAGDARAPTDEQAARPAAAVADRPAAATTAQR
jgi:hypothetical protein